MAPRRGIDIPVDVSRSRRGFVPSFSTYETLGCVYWYAEAQSHRRRPEVINMDIQDMQKAIAADGPE